MYEIIGIRRLDYTNKSGRPVLGYSIHFGENQKDAFGLMTFSSFLSDERMKPVLLKYPVDQLVGKKCDLSYNRFGNLEGISVK